MKIIGRDSSELRDLYPVELTRLTQKGSLSNLGFGLFAKDAKRLDLPFDATMQEIHELLSSFPIPPAHVIFSSISLNFCINQLISSTTYVVEVEKGYARAVFELLKQKIPNVVLLQPSQEAFMDYWKPGTIVIYDLFSRAPLGENGGIAIEQLIVDLLFDPGLSSLYSGRDVEMAIETLCKYYAINYRTLLAYARRRKKENELKERIGDLVPKEVKEAFVNAK